MNFPIVANEGFEAAEPLPRARNERSISLHELWAVVYRSRLWIAGIIAACILAGVIYSLLATRLYEASVSIEVRQEAEKVLGTEADREGPSSRADADRFLQTQLDIIRSRGVATAVAQTLGFFRGDEFLVRMGEDPDDTLRPGLSPAENRREQVIQALQENLAVQYTGNTRIADLRFTSRDPELAMQVANAYADNFIRNNLARKFNSSTYALDFLRDQLREAQSRLEKSEQGALDYARRSRLVDASNAAGSSGSGGDQTRPLSLVTAQLVQLNQAYSTAVAERIQAEQKWRRTAELPALTVPEVLQNPAIQGLLEKRAQLEASYEQQLATRREDFPAVRQIKAELAELSEQMNRIAREIRTSVRNPYDVALARERELASRLETLKNSTLSEQNQGIQLSILRREAETNRAQYDALLRRYNSLNAEAGVQTNNLNIVDRADRPRRPSWPKLPLILALAVVAGLVLAGIFVIVREQLFDAVRTPDDVSDRLRLPLLGSIPPSEDPNAAARDPKSWISEAFNSVRTSLAVSTEHGVPKVLMVTSAQAGEGKSNACRALAFSLARFGSRVAVVDVDFRRPNLHRLFEIDNDVGLSNVLAGQVDIEDAMQMVEGGSVALLPTGTTAPNPSELIASAQFEAVINRLCLMYDVVLLDSAPVLGLADAPALASRVRNVLFIVEAGRNTFRGLEGALGRLLSGDARLCGVVLTKFDPGRFGYGYGDRYAYSYKYDYAKKP